MYHIFLSHSKQDLPIVYRIYTDLRAKGLRVWIDESGLPPGTPSWRHSIATAIRESNCMVVLLSPSALQSTWVSEEIEYAECHEKPVIPVLIKGSERESIPFGYLGTQRIDLRNTRNYAAGLQALVKAAYGEQTIFDSPTLPAALGKTLLHKMTLPPTRPSKQLIDGQRKTVELRAVPRRRWHWVTRLFRLPGSPANARSAKL